MKVNKVFPYKYSYNKSKLLICHDNSLMTRTSPIIIVITLWSILYSDAPHNIAVTAYVLGEGK